MLDCNCNLTRVLMFGAVKDSLVRGTCFRISYAGVLLVVV